jgi:hypothetical protein
MNLASCEISNLYHMQGLEQVGVELLQTEMP